MSYPTLLSPWYVVYRLNNREKTRLDVTDYEMQWYKSPQSEEDEKNLWTSDQQQAMIITSLQSAVRIAYAMAGEVRVLTTREELMEFRPEGAI